jgi:hypothetical protein
VLPFFSLLAPCVVGIEACATSHHWGSCPSRRPRAEPLA